LWSLGSIRRCSPCLLVGRCVVGSELLRQAQPLLVSRAVRTQVSRDRLNVLLLRDLPPTCCLMAIDLWEACIMSYAFHSSPHVAASLERAADRRVLSETPLMKALTMQFSITTSRSPKGVVSLSRACLCHGSCGECLLPVGNIQLGVRPSLEAGNQFRSARLFP